MPVSESEVHEQLKNRFFFFLFFFLFFFFISGLMVVLWSLSSGILDFGSVKDSL